MKNIILCISEKRNNKIYLLCIDLKISYVTFIAKEKILKIKIILKYHFRLDMWNGKNPYK